MADQVTRLSADDIETLIHLVAITQLPDTSSAKIKVQQSLSTQVSEILNHRIRIRGRSVGEDEFNRALEVAKTAMAIEVLKVKYKDDVQQLFDLRPRRRETTGGADGNARTGTIEREIRTATGQERVHLADNEADREIKLESE